MIVTQQHGNKPITEDGQAVLMAHENNNNTDDKFIITSPLQFSNYHLHQQASSHGSASFLCFVTVNSINYLFDIGFGPLGTSCASAPNFLRLDFDDGGDDDEEEEEEEVCVACVCFGCKFMVVEAGSEDSNRNLLMEIDATIFVGLIGLLGLVIKTKTKRSARKRKKWCDLLRVSLIVDCDFGVAMQEM